MNNSRPKNSHTSPSINVDHLFPNKTVSHSNPTAFDRFPSLIPRSQRCSNSCCIPAETHIHLFYDVSSMLNFLSFVLITREEKKCGTGHFRQSGALRAICNRKPLVLGGAPQKRKTYPAVEIKWGPRAFYHQRHNPVFFNTLSFSGQWNGPGRLFGLMTQSLFL